jgi:tetratricopeptide (TPR) repeat protein
MKRRLPSLLATFLLAPALAFGADEAAVRALESKISDLMRLKQYPALIETGKKLLEISPENPAALHHIGYALHADGKIDEALEYHKRGAATKSEFQATCTYNAGCAYAVKGDADAAFEWFEKAVALGGIPVSQYKNDPDLASLRAGPRYEKLIASVANKGKPSAPSGPPKPAFVVYSQVSPRELTRVAVFDSDDFDCRGQVAIEYGTVQWKNEYAAQIESGSLDGMRWRLGTDFWTNLDASADFKLGNQEFAAGTYFLAAERTKEGKYLLTLIEAKSVYPEKFDAFNVTKTSGGTAIEMNHETLDEPAPSLKIKLATKNQVATAGTLEISFGPHRLSTPFKIAVEE